MKHRQNRVRRAAAAVTVAGLTLLTAATAPQAMAAGTVATVSSSPIPVPPPNTVPSPLTVSQADASSEAALVAAEDRRLIQVRAVASIAPRSGSQWKSPYRLETGTGYTLVLTARSAPYTVADLLQLAPTTFLRQSDGSYLLLENLYLSMGASLTMTAPGGLKLHLASSPAGFVSIVSFGGNLSFIGTPQAPISITSWDPRTAEPDTTLADGRAYIRSIGGKFVMSYAQIQDLGFWSGRTGGIGLTGTARAASGATSGPSVYSKSKGAGKTGKAATQNGTAAAAPADPNLGQSGVTSQPAGPLGTPTTQFSVPGLSYVSTQIDHTAIAGNAFGLFISGATGIVVSDDQISGSLVAGLVLHRFATQAVIQRVSSTQNYGDGIIIARAAQQIQISDCTASYNVGNGFTVNGQPISQGPSASGEALGAYGNNVLSQNTAQANGHYGIEVLGGLNVSLDNNTIIGNLMGIVVRRAAQKVTIAGNILKNQDREGISIRDGVQAVTVSANVIEGAATGIYARGSVADITGNTVTGASIHGVTLVGPVAGTLVHDNTLTGIGPGPINTSRATGAISVGSNQTGGWFNTTALWVRIKALIRPLTIIWFLIFLLITVTAVKGRRTRTGGGKRHKVRRARAALGAHPYQEQRLLPPAVVVADRSMETGQKVLVAK